MSSSKTKIIACVLRTGGVYNVDYVNRLANAVARNVTVPYRFVCLTDADQSSGFGTNVHEMYSLRNVFPGWWSKMELFRGDLYPEHDWLFLDLDTVIINNIDEIVSSSHHCLTALDDFYRPGSLGSGLLAWQPMRYRAVYDTFVNNPQLVMQQYSEGGDQQWIQASISTFLTFQSRFPDAVVSFKKHCTRTSTDILVPKDAKIICFHGTPKPHETVQLITIKENWK